MKYVNRVVGKDGVERLYLRKRGLPSIRLRGAWGSDELAREVAGLVSNEGRRPLAGTLGLAVRAYELESAEFAALRASTRREYRYILRELEEDLGEVPIAALQGTRILQLRDTWARRGQGFRYMYASDVGGRSGVIPQLIQKRGQRRLKCYDDT